MKQRIGDLMDKQIFGFEVELILITLVIIPALFIGVHLWITLLEKIGIRKPGQNDDSVGGE
jgi:hypothetical protein